jgi:hypothetical protein
MSESAIRKGRIGGQEELNQCPVCGDYFNVTEGFYCPQCKGGPFCRKHRVQGRKECVSCVMDLRLNEIKALKDQERSIDSFVRFIQFVFLMFAVFFVASKTGILEEVAILQHSIVHVIFMENLIYFGIGSAILYGIFFVIQFNQRKKIEELESQIDKLGIRKY